MPYSSVINWTSAALHLYSIMASLASESTPQASTLRRHFSDLIRAIEDPVLLAVDLYSANIITQAMLERVTDVPSLTRTDKTSLLLGAVSDQTVISPATFNGFLSILSEDHGALVPDIVEEMKVPMPAPGTVIRYLYRAPICFWVVHVLVEETIFVELWVVPAARPDPLLLPDPPLLPTAHFYPTAHFSRGWVWLR